MALATNTTDDTMDDIHWGPLLAPAPLGILVTSHLLISSSRGRDFRIDQVGRDKIPLLEHPDSFRKTIVQVTNKSYDAYMKAHDSMHKIQLTMEEVPNYLKDCVSTMKSGNPSGAKMRLDRIKEAAEEGKRLSTEVETVFVNLESLLQQVNIAISTSQGAKEKKIQATIKAGIQDRQLRSKKKEKKTKKKEEQQTRKMEQQSREYLNQVCKREWTFFENYFFLQPSLGHASDRTEEIEKPLEKIKQEVEQAKKEINKISEKFIENLKNINVVKETSADEMIKLINEATEVIIELQKNWSGITQFFTAFDNNIGKVTENQIKDFVTDVNDPTPSNAILLKTMHKSLDSYIKSHRTAANYLKVSDRYIMGPLKAMKDMVGKPECMTKTQELELNNSCKKACDAIERLINEDKKKILREIENEKQNRRPFYFVL